MRRANLLSGGFSSGCARLGDGVSIDPAPEGGGGDRRPARSARSRASESRIPFGPKWSSFGVMCEGAAGSICRYSRVSRSQRILTFPARRMSPHSWCRLPGLEMIRTRRELMPCGALDSPGTVRGTSGGWRRHAARDLLPCRAQRPDPQATRSPRQNPATRGFHRDS